jgi:hypothetical protein
LRGQVGNTRRVAEVGDADEDGFKGSATGPGRVFQPPVPIKEMDWFPGLLRGTGHFGLGVQEVKDEAVIADLCHLAAQAGYEVA